MSTMPDPSPAVFHLDAAVGALLDELSDVPLAHLVIHAFDAGDATGDLIDMILANVERQAGVYETAALSSDAVEVDTFLALVQRSMRVVRELRRRAAVA